MKKFIKIVFILELISFVFVFSACSSGFFSYKGLEVGAKLPRRFTIYVCGAVANEGFVQVVEGASVDKAISLARILPQTVLPNNLQMLITEKDTVLILNYLDGTEIRNCVNVNGTLIARRATVPGIDVDVINKIADYYFSHGKITDRTLLKGILGDDYQDNFYKFYVDVNDYEKVS